MSEPDVAARVARKLMATPIGKLWWSADDEDEAEKWRAECMARGAIAFENCHGCPPITCIVTLYRDETANRVAGYTVGEDEWLEE